MNIDFTHKMAAHCENGTTANLLNFHGIKLSEPLVFGIGAGCFFSYTPFIRVNNLPVISFRHWPGVIFRRTTSGLGVQVETMKFSSPAKSMDELDKLIEKGIPVGLLVGVFNLPYFPPEYRFHFNAHNLVVIGKQNDLYYISDPVMENIETLNGKELQRVRFAKGTYPPKGRMYWIRETPQTVDIEKAISVGIKKNCSYMLRIPVPLFGVKGIRYIAGRLKNWDSRFGDYNAALRLGQFIRMLEEIGTGGAGFRFIYAAFLQEAATILNKPELKVLSSEMTGIGDRWRNFAAMAAKNLRNRGVPATPYPHLSHLLLQIADQEEKLFRNLDGIFK
ncbi:MAG TPA: BtrH N-terminal domain-containing protein [Bacteroidales bacterium]|nr:BtrH N-terminal domain-containing protein [Bacteroidales bacterium]